MDIHLGYEIGSGEPVAVPQRHTVVTGITQYGKTTALEALVTRAGMTAIVFITKPGENILPGAPRLKPYLKAQSDWRYVEEVISASLRERSSRMLRPKIMEVTRNTKSLASVHSKVKNKLKQPKLRAFDRDLYTELDHYLDIVVPQIEESDLAQSLEILWDRVQVLDLMRFTQEMQMLLMRSVMEEVHQHADWHDIIIVVPEAHAFVPQGRNTPVKSIAQLLIRQGLTLRKLVWFDSQDIASCDKGVLKQCDVWLLGRQREYNEAMHTIDQIPMPRSARPKPEDVMMLDVGHFYLSAGNEVKKVYVQPPWLESWLGQEVARGKLPLPEAPGKPEAQEDPVRIQELETRVAELEKQVNDLREDNRRLIQDAADAKQATVEFQESRDAADGKIVEARELFLSFLSLFGIDLGKAPVQVPANIDLDAVVQKASLAVLAQLGSQGQVMQVTAPEALRKGFEQEALDRIKRIIGALDPRGARIVAWLAQHDKAATCSDLALHVEGHEWSRGGRYAVEFPQILKGIVATGLIKAVPGNRYISSLKAQIEARMAPYSPGKDVIERVHENLLYLLTQEKTPEGGQ